MINTSTICTTLKKADFLVSSTFSLSFIQNITTKPLSYSLAFIKKINTTTKWFRVFCTKSKRINSSTSFARTQKCLWIFSPSLFKDSNSIISSQKKWTKMKQNYFLIKKSTFTIISMFWSINFTPSFLKFNI